MRLLHGTGCPHPATPRSLVNMRAASVSHPSPYERHDFTPQSQACSSFSPSSRQPSHPISHTAPTDSKVLEVGEGMMNELLDNLYKNLPLTTPRLTSPTTSSSIARKARRMAARMAPSSVIGPPATAGSCSSQTGLRWEAASHCHHVPTAGSQQVPTLKHSSTGLKTTAARLGADCPNRLPSGPKQVAGGLPVLFSPLQEKGAPSSGLEKLLDSTADAQISSMWHVVPCMAVPKDSMPLV